MAEKAWVFLFAHRANLLRFLTKPAQHAEHTEAEQ